MMPAAKTLDPVLGVDIHIVQPPGPVPPVPIPHPFIGMLIDPFDFVPIIGATIFVNGSPRALAGTAGKALPPHIPIGGMFVKPPANECEMFMGSSTVVADGDPFSYTALPALSCQDIGMIAPFRMNPKKKTKMKSLVLPTSVVLPIPMGAPVLVGGSPTISMMAMGMRIGMAGLGKAFKKLSKTRAAQRAMDAFAAARKKAFKNMKPGFLKCKILKAEPVNSVTGEVVVEQQDIDIPGRIPIAWTRTYGSQSDYKGACGNGWQTPADIRLEVDPDGTVAFYDGGLGAAVFPKLPGTDPIRELSNGATLYVQDESYFVRIKGGIRYEFARTNLNSTRNQPTLVTIPVTSIRDGYDNSLVFVRDKRGALVRIDESSGRYIVVSSVDGLVRELAFGCSELPQPRTLARYEYDLDGNLLAVYDALDHPHRFEYTDGLLSRSTDRNGLSFYYEYKLIGETNKCVHAYGDGYLYDYQFEYRESETIVTNSLNYKWAIAFDADKLPTKEYDQKGVLEGYEYDDMGRTTTVTDANGNRVMYEYDASGNLLVERRPDGTTVQRSYDGHNNTIAITDARGNVWRQAWNEQDRVTSQITPNGGETLYEHDEMGDLVKIVDPMGNTIKFQMNQYGQLVAMTNALGQTTSFDADPMGNVVTERSPGGMETKYRYDRLNRLIEMIFPSGDTSTCDYDSQGNLIYYRDELGDVTRIEYAGLGEVRKRFQPDGTTVEYEWDTEEQLVSVTNGLRQKYSLVRDDRGRIVREIDYWNNATEYTYDRVDNLIRTLDPLGRSTEFAYDSVNQLLEKHLPDGDVERFSYDQNGNVIAHQNKSSATITVFDAENQCVEERQGDLVLCSAYDLNGNRRKRSSSHGNEVLYEYDAVNRVIGLSVNGTVIGRIQRNADGLVVKELLGAGVERDSGYSRDGLLTRQTVTSPGGPALERRFGYDGVGQLKERNDSRKGNTYFSYDPMGRIISYTDPAGKLQKFLYDASGNLQRPTMRPQGRMRVRVEKLDGATYHYDANGNLIERFTADGHARLEWDGNARLIKFSNGDGLATTMAYDARGRRVHKETHGRRTTFGWDGDQLLSDQTGGAKAREFVYYPDSFIPVAFVADNNIYTYHTDGIGLPHEVTDSSGAIVWSARFGAFGTVERLDIATIGNPVRFQGQYFDEETNLYYTRFRHYDPFIGAFVTQDPLGLLAGEGLYIYAPNPWSWIDPFGLHCIRNKSLAGKVHPETGVPFNRNGFPVFDSAFDTRLSKDLLKASDARQFKQCNEKLLKAIRNDPALAKKFSQKDIKRLEKGKNPKGYTWHHNQEKGKMQLVDQETHAKTGHTGGATIWGGR